MKVELEAVYQSELMANTDLHAGGLFFCIIYVNCLTFEKNGQVILTQKIIDPFRPMDPYDVKQIENFKSMGKYYENDRGYLICDFEDIFVKLTGMFTIKNPDLIVFHAFSKRLDKQWSELYKIVV